MKGFMATNWKCDTCGKKFGVGEWTCNDGIRNHVVQEKTYLVCDAPADPGKPADGSLMPIVRGRTKVCNIPPPKKQMENGEVKYVGEGSVEFINGRFSTSDPEIQYWLDQKGAYNKSEAEWEACWMTDKERLAKKELELVAYEQRLHNERNELLAQTKERVGAR